MRHALTPLLLSTLLSLPTPLLALTPGQTETFSSPHHWITAGGPGGIPATPIPTSLGGPTGPADPFLNLTSAGSSGPNSRLSAQNLTDWAGNYLAASIPAIRMDVNNLGTSDLSLRLLFLEFDASSQPRSAAFSTSAIFVPAGSGWTTVTFDITPAALTPVPFLPVQSPTDSLSNTSELRLFHNPDPFFTPGSNPPITAHLGLDNLTALPEPTLAPLLLTLLPLTRRKPKLYN